MPAQYYYNWWKNDKSMLKPKPIPTSRPTLHKSAKYEITTVSVPSVSLWNLVLQRGKNTSHPKQEIPWKCEYIHMASLYILYIISQPTTAFVIILCDTHLSWNYYFYLNTQFVFYVLCCFLGGQVLSCIVLPSAFIPWLSWLSNPVKHVTMSNCTI